jgi:hypothetical protein
VFQADLGSGRIRLTERGILRLDREPEAIALRLQYKG